MLAYVPFSFSDSFVSKKILSHKIRLINERFLRLGQRAKKVVSDSLGLVDVTVVLVIFVLNLPDRQVLFFREIQITEGL